MSIFRWPQWDPLGGLRIMQRELERLTGRGLFGQGRQIGGGVYPPINVLNSPDEIVVQFELAGVAKEDVDLSITGETLVVKGVKKAPPDDDSRSYTRRERPCGEFSRTIVLPDKVDGDRIDANMDAGILTVRLPKSEAARPKQIKVK